MSPRPTPCALAIAGLDPSGGAGVFADLRAFATANVWGCGAVAVLTVQSTSGLRSSHPVETGQLLAQVREVFAHQNVRSVKIGALGSTSNARAVARFLPAHAPRVPVVLDPVMLATRSHGGARLLEASAGPTLLDLARRATLVTPNVPEAEAMLGTRITSVDEAERAALALLALGIRSALVKGGHLPRRSSARVTTDVLAVGRRVVHLEAPRLKISVHGSGCLLSSLIAGKLARTGRVTDEGIVDAVRWAKKELGRALAHPHSVGDGLQVVST